MGQTPSHPALPQLPNDVDTLLSDVRNANSLASRINKEGFSLWFYVSEASLVESGFNSVRLLASIVVTKIPCWKESTTSDSSSSQSDPHSREKQPKAWKVLSLRNFYAAYFLLQQQQPAEYEEEEEREDDDQTHHHQSQAATSANGDSSSNAAGHESSSNGSGYRPRRKSSIKSEEEREDEEEGECPICFEQIKNGLSLPCMHGPFCQTCILQWNVNHKSCPVCRRAVAADSVDCWVHLDAPSTTDMVDSLFSFIAKTGV